MIKKYKLVVFLLYSIFGLYFINSGLGFIILPEFVLNFDKWIILIGGILVLIGAVNYLRAGKKMIY
jgi:hypothetical protein